MEGGTAHMIVSEKRAQIKDPGTVHKFLLSLLKKESQIDRDKEHFWTIGLSTRHSTLYVDLVSLGTLNASLVHPRETFRLAITRAVHSVIIAHNHPSGDTTPSDDDQALSRRLVDAGRLLGIEVLDHVIIAGEDRFSFKENGLM
jgi:DNA repair protein RadC